MDIELLISPVDARPMVRDKGTIFITTEMKQKRAWIEVCVGLEEDLEARYKNNIAINQITVRPLQITAHSRLIFQRSSSFHRPVKKKKIY